MTQEEYLREQIESYIDQLDLLKMQEQFDQASYNRVVEECVRLIEQYDKFLKEKVGSDIQAIERRFVVTIDEALEKRVDILLVASGHETLLEDLLADTGHAPELRERTGALLEAAKKQVAEYQSDVDLMKQQLQEIAIANEKEGNLEAEKTKLFLEYSILRNSQVSYRDLGIEMSEKYAAFIEVNGIENIDLQTVQSQRTIYLERQAQLEQNLTLARKAKDAEGYEKVYEKKLKENKLQIDKLDEQIFLCLVSKIMAHPVDSYDSLAKRTATIETLMAKRIKAVEVLYAAGIVQDTEYRTSATTIDHSKIKRQLEDLKQMNEKTSKIDAIDKELEHLRDHIKGKRELEEYFEQRAIAAGRTPGKPEMPSSSGEKTEKSEEEPLEKSDEIVEEPQILEFTDSYDGYETLNNRQVIQDKKNRKKVVAAEGAKPGLLKRLFSDKLKKILSEILNITTIFSSLGGIFSASQVEAKALEIAGQTSQKIQKDIEVTYYPSIGDKLRLTKGSQIYSTSMNAASGINGYDAMTNGIGNDDLFVTRGAILDQNGTILYLTTEYGIDLVSVAQSMGLEKGSYRIALGCALGDLEGNFIQVPDNALNPTIEKGWINASEINMVIIEQLRETLEKGGRSI